MLKITITHICERCGKDKEVAVNINDTSKTFSMSDLLDDGIYSIENKGVCKDCYNAYHKLIEKQKKELGGFIEKKE